MKPGDWVVLAVLVAIAVVVAVSTLYKPRPKRDGDDA